MRDTCKQSYRLAITICDIKASQEIYLFDASAERILGMKANKLFEIQQENVGSF